jgi:hypothetical protein
VILTPFLPCRHVLLLAIAAAAGILASLLADRLMQPRAPADMQQALYFVAMLPDLLRFSVLRGGASRDPGDPHRPIDRAVRAPSPGPRQTLTV